MIQRQWRHWLHFVPEVHLSEWFRFLNSQNGHPAEIFSNRAMLCLNMPNWPTDQTSSSITKHICFCCFGQFWPVALWFSLLLRGSFSTWLQSERVRRRARSKLQREAKCLLNLLFPSFSGGESTWAHMKKWNNLFNVFESAYLMKKHHSWRVVESKCRILPRKFLASYARPPAQSNAMLRQRTTLQVRRNVQQLPSKDEDRTLHYTMTRCRTWFCCWNRWTLASFTRNLPVSQLRQPKRVHMSSENMSTSSNWACSATFELLANVNVGIQIIWCCFESVHFCSQHVHCLRNAANSQRNLSFHIIQYRSCHHFPAVFTP